VFIPVVFICRSCGWRVRVELPSNAGPPNIKRKLQELLGVIIPYSCPNCGRAFDISKVEVKFGEIV
jgi:predicted RNA-binding Zn-ribbon protein involved in translation (DUF1610 family)